MARRNEGKTRPYQLKYKRKILLEKSSNKLTQLKDCIEVLKKNEIDCDLIQRFYEKEKRHNIKLTKLILGED